MRLTVISIIVAFSDAATTGFPWLSVATDATGHLLAGCGSSGYTATSIAISDDSGTNWKNTASPVLPWWAVASDNSGKVLAAVANCQSANFIGCTSPYVSIDRGAKWTEGRGTGDALCYSIAIDSTALTMFSICLYADASKGQMLGMFKSTNSGRDWAQVQAPYKQDYNGYSYPLALSDNGRTVMYIIESAVNVWNSSMWTQSSLTGSWNALATDSSSVKLAAVAGYKSSSGSSGLLVLSSDSGKTWTTVSKLFFKSVATDTTGQVVFAAGGDNEGIYAYNRNTGSFTKTAAPKLSWTSISCDTSCKILVAAASTSGVYISLDSGMSWKLT